MNKLTHTRTHASPRAQPCNCSLVVNDAHRHVHIVRTMQQSRDVLFAANVGKGQVKVLDFLLLLPRRPLLQRRDGVHNGDEVLPALVTVHVVDDAEPLQRSTVVYITDYFEQEQVLGEEQDVHRPGCHSLHAAVSSNHTNKAADFRLRKVSDERVVTLPRSCPLTAPPDLPSI